ncbi:TolC family protein [Carboxylicivirga marina]|uniref:TolC family protein n=1 Tax=Carboxylicivirga marina TaxID=2800988 RepID=A0ABS1HN88_9BACT|nr:TolC family protein [Carboxylicivirga marina]MBK3519134.1 TolC family protein [Carboxylicivirga marina]
MRQFIISLMLVSWCFQPKAQNLVTPPNKTIQLTLSETIQLATLQSITSFRNKNEYLSKYWRFRNYKAKQLPRLRLNTTPINYSRGAYANDNNVFEYRETINSNANISLNQRIIPTGTTVRVISSLSGLQNINRDDSGINRSTTLSSKPISVSIEQPLNGYNAFKWDSKLEPLEYKKAKRTFISDTELLSKRAVQYFFNTVGAHIDVAIAETNLANADTLYNIGKGRFQIGTVTQDELLDLELTYLNAKIAKTRATVELQRSRNLLNSFLGFEKDVIITPLIPDKIPSLKVKTIRALELAKENNPEILELERQVINANKNLAFKKSNSGISANLLANIGITKQSEEIKEVYQSPFDEGRGVSIRLSAPILDWGERKGDILMAKSDKQVTEAKVKQALIDFEQEVIMEVLQFNLQEDQVNISAKADTVALLGYDVTKQRFMIDKVDVIKLNAARNSQNSARRRYINSLSEFWQRYYTLRQITLFDFERNETLIKSLDYLLEN